MASNYGNLISNKKLALDSPLLTQLKTQGYCILGDCCSPAEADELVRKLEAVYAKQVDEFGLERLDKIKELDVVRAPLLSDASFLMQLALNPKILSFVETAIDGSFQIHLQNGIINRPKKIHFQTSWHRDLPYQNWVASKPLALSVLVCLTDFCPENGATNLIPSSHLLETIPSVDYIEENKIAVTVGKGSALVFNSMLVHAAGINNTDSARVGINHIYSIPIIKQQINFAEEIKSQHPQLSAKELEIIGSKYESPKSVLDWRLARLQRE